MNSSVIEEYFTYKPLHALQWIQLICSVVSVIIVVYTIYFHVRKSWFEGVFKETLYALYFFILWHDIFTIFLQIIQIGSRLMAKTACDMLFSRHYCILRVIITLAYPSFVCIHLAVSVQRFITTFSDNSRLHYAVTRFLLVLTVFYCIVYVVLSYFGYRLDGETAYCSGMVTGNASVLLFNSFALMVIDVLNVIFALVLIRVNQNKIMALNSSAAPLSVKFRHRQTLQSSKQMLPGAFLHLLFFMLQYAGFEYANYLPYKEVPLVTVNGLVYMMPYYCCILPLVLLFLMIREERKKKRELVQISSSISSAASAEFQNHFSSLQLQWENDNLVESHAWRVRSKLAALLALRNSRVASA